MRRRADPLTAVIAVLFAAITIAVYGSTTGPGTTGNDGPTAAPAVIGQDAPVEVHPPITITEAAPAPLPQVPDPNGLLPGGEHR